MKRTSLSCLAVLFLACGCIDSKNPLSAPDAAKVDDGLLGTWREPSANGDTYYHIGLAGEKYPAGMLRIIEVARRDKVLCPPTEYLAFTSTLEGKTYLNVVLDPAQMKVWDKSGWKADAVDGYIFVKYQLDGDKATVWTVDAKAKEEAIKAGKIQGEIKEKSEGRFTDSSENVAKFVAASGDKLLNTEAGHMERVAEGKK